MATKKRETVQRDSLGLAKMGNAKAILGTPESQRELLVGTLGGYAHDIKLKTMDNGDVFEGLQGNFRFVPADTMDGDIIETGLVYLSPGMTGLVKDQLIDKETGKTGKPVQFIFDIVAIKEANAAGFTRKYVPKFAPQAESPLDKLFQLASSPGAKQIEAPKAGKAA